ncbi:DUF4350 domain-containing protein [Pseudomonas cichorii]|uniref:DUF4350 domain-containing protein n=1 Tax=Pseudomonas cichorii TaxID=36746 RepID=A0ABQ1DK49_PSECI|nr:DUF4350 domain-containing protein [Pseudomonas cichorii]AHF69289.1 hypothetical protein PCH70_41360 [Pseudomonas cichorii JBC1]QVE16238.1 DUF4350 domain-containing protein [Pseudomonas cichorii]GFM91381.1 hypothetical protein PSCICP_13530 [Pseudomonas cichorii]SDN15725.1 protein of unknown function [Pseudomonas cichorii]
MNRRKQILIGLLVLVALMLGGVYAYKHLEPYEEVIDQGPSPEVAANPYLAAEHFLRQRSPLVNTTRNLLELPDVSQQPQTLLLLDSRENMTPAQVERLLDWARSGGHLLFVAEQIWDEKKNRSGDLLLDRVEIRQYFTRDIKLQDREEERLENDALPKPSIPLIAPRTSKPSMRWPELTRLYLENEKEPAYMSFNQAFHLEDPQDHAQSWANSADATHMMQMVYGKGLITVVTDSDLWKNRAITRYDNAWLLWYLTQDSAVTMVLETGHDNLASLLLRNFPLALVTLALLLGLTLWHAGLREGPLQAPAARGRRQLAEHLRASADFVRRRSGHQALIKSLQTDILRRARQRHPGFERLGVTDQWQVLARLTRQPTSAISDALRPRPSQRMSSAEFTRQVAHLQSLRNAL